METFILFGFNYYYPEGGPYDFLGQFATLDEAKTVAEDYPHPRDHFSIARVTQDEFELVLNW